ncbi:hypothetical protein Tco_0947654 [Tanacetum coccineum]
MVESLPTMVDTLIKEQVPEQVRDQVPVYVAEGLILERQKSKEEMEQMIAKAILQELDASVRSYMSGHILHVHPVQSLTTSIPEQQYQLSFAVHPRDQDDPNDDAHLEGENSAKWQKTSEYEEYLSRESSSRQVNEEERGADKSKFTRKQSKTGKHGHENQKSTKRSQRIKAEARKVKP